MGAMIAILVKKDFLTNAFNKVIEIEQEMFK